MNSDEIQHYLQLLGEELQQRSVTGEIVMAGGAMMLLVIQNRETTKDIDAYFATNPQIIREAAQVIVACSDGGHGKLSTSDPARNAEAAEGPIIPVKYVAPAG